MESKNIKETINLLDLLSESESDLSDLIIATPKKKKIKRRQRSGGRNKQSSCFKSQTKIITLWIAAVLIMFWLIALSWLAVILYGEIGKMNSTIKSVATTRCLLFC